GTTIVNCGDDQSYTITPNTNFIIGDVLVDGSSVGPVSSYIFTSVQANHAISASFIHPPCTSTPVPGNTQSTASTVCPSTSFTLSLQNDYSTVSSITYQWQSSPDGVTYSNIPGATSATYTTTESAATWYQCIVTCASNGSGTSA